MPAHRKDYSNAEAMYEQGLSIACVAAACGVTRQTMWKILARRGIAMRQLEPAVTVYWCGVKYSVR